MNFIKSTVFAFFLSIQICAAINIQLTVRNYLDVPVRPALGRIGRDQAIDYSVNVADQDFIEENLKYVVRGDTITLTVSGDSKSLGVNLAVGDRHKKLQLYPSTKVSFGKYFASAHLNEVSAGSYSLELDFGIPNGLASDKQLNSGKHFI